MRNDRPRILYAKRFEKQLKKAPLPIKEAFRNRRVLFQHNPFHPLLNNHALTGKYTGYRSINVTGDWRAIFREEMGQAGRTVVFLLVDTHSNLYG